MTTLQRQTCFFQKDWIGTGERGIRDRMLIPAIFFGAVSPGLFISSLFFDYTPGLWIALVMNFIGYGLTHLLYLGRMERFWRGLSNVRTSWISRGLLFNIIFSVSALLYACAVTFESPILSGGRIVLLLKIASATSAVLFAAYPGFMLSFVKAIPFWRSTLEPVLFFIQAIMGGVAVQILSLTITGVNHSMMSILLRMNFVLVLFVLILILTALIMKALHGEAERVSVRSLISGALSPHFLWGTIVAGLMVPLFFLAVIILSGLDGNVPELLLYPVMLLQLSGIYLGKYSIIRAGAYAPVTGFGIGIRG